MKRFFLIICICLALLLIYVYIFPIFLPKPNYVIGFPEEKSEGRTELLLHRGIYNSYIITEKEQNEISLSHHVFDEDHQHVLYETILEDTINEHYEPIYGSKDNGKEFSELRTSFADQLSSNTDMAIQQGYPKVTVEREQAFTITTNSHEERFDIADVLGEYGRHGNELFTLDVQKANKDSFFLTISFSSSRVEDVYHLFMSQDFSTIEVVDGEIEPFAEQIASGKLDDFSDLIFQTDINDRYVMIRGLHEIYDRENKEIAPIHKSDLLSKDGKYVYINGDPSAFKKGKQRIQKTEDYLTGNKQYDRTFRMDFKQIAKEFGITGFPSANDPRPIYFNENYIMYSIPYKAVYIGSAGHVNVIVDLQDPSQKPTFYLFNFGLLL